MINFIHVGKCAGSSIGSELRANGIAVAEYHCFDAHEIVPSLIKNNSSDFFIVTVRDPIKRFVSAFYWDLYEKRVINKYCGPSNFWALLYDRYSKPNSLAESLTSTDKEAREMARTAFESSALHMQFSLSWYIPPSVVRYLHKENCFIVRTENASTDFNRYIDEYHGIKSKKSLPRQKSEYKNEIPGYDESLSDLAICNLKKIYFEDYFVLDGFFRKGLIAERYN